MPQCDGGRTKQGSIYYCVLDRGHKGNCEDNGGTRFPYEKAGLLFSRTDFTKKYKRRKP